MTIQILHATLSAVPDDGSGRTGPNQWNEAHDVSGIACHVATRSELKSVDTSTFPTCSLLEDGRQGDFDWDTSDLSSVLTPLSVTTTSIDSGTDIATKSAHGLQSGDPVYPTTTVDGLTAETIYYAIRLSASTFQLATSYVNAMAGTYVDLTATTNVTLKKFIDPAEVKYVIPTGSAVDGSEGAWVRRFSGHVDVRWADATAGADISTALAACRAVLGDGGSIYIPTGSYLMAYPVHLTDTVISVFGDGEDATTITASGSSNDMFIFDSLTTTSGARVPSGGLVGMTIDGNDIVDRCVKTVSTNYGFFDRLRISGALEDNFLATTQNGQPSSQHNHYGQIEILLDGSANGFRGTGSQDAGANGNWSLNTIDNLFVLMGGSTPSGHGLYFGFSDGNHVKHFRNYAPAGATGYGVYFAGDDSGTVTGGAHARLNVIDHCQPGLAGVFAEAGSSYSSANSISMYSLGNGSPTPEVESGAYLGYATYYDGRRGTFTPTLFGSSTAGTPTYSVQKGDYWIVGNMLHFNVGITITATGGMAGNIKIGNFPFSASSAGNNVNTGFAPSKIKCNFTASYYTASGVMQGGQNSFFLFQNGPGLAATTITAGLIPSDFAIEISGAYPVGGA